MKIPKEELTSVLAQFTPWWREEKIFDLPPWKRAVFTEIEQWVIDPPAHRAVMLSGPRQVGKTTLVLQMIETLLSQGVKPGKILYVTFDHPLFKLAGLEAVLEAWGEMEPTSEGTEYLFLDEAQFLRDFGTWVKHQIDFSKKRRILFTGSATPLINSGEESGVGRWHTIKVSTLSFYEYLQIKQIHIPNIPKIEFLPDINNSSISELQRMTEATQALIGHFHEYLVRGGLPQTSLVENVLQAQKLLREDIIDKVLKRDMTALFGVRRVLELEQTFIYLCMHNGGIQDIASLCNNLNVPKPTVQNFLNLLETTHLISRLAQYGNGKEILRARYKFYLSDPAIVSAILLKGKTLLEDPAALGIAVETTILSHLSAHSFPEGTRFSYWKDSKNKEQDLVIESCGELFALEVKYRSQKTTLAEVSALERFCDQKNLSIGYVITKNSSDIGNIPNTRGNAKILRIPAALFCYWIGESEIMQKNLLRTS